MLFQWLLLAMQRTFDDDRKIIQTLHYCHFFIMHNTVYCMSAMYYLILFIIFHHFCVFFKISHKIDFYLRVFTISVEYFPKFPRKFLLLGRNKTHLFLRIGSELKKKAAVVSCKTKCVSFCITSCGGAVPGGDEVSPHFRFYTFNSNSAIVIYSLYNESKIFYMIHHLTKK